MHRLFVAIRPPRLVREHLLAAMGGVGGARWQSDEQLHLTLRFIGEVDRRVAEDVDAALRSVHQPPFEIALNGTGAFDRRGVPSALWAGVTPHEPLAALHRKIEQALVRAGIAPEGRAFLPHITLARLPRGAGPVEGFVRGQSGLSGTAFTVDAFGLFESRLAPGGAEYMLVERYSLG
jgi:2'-5' RNA ligase